MYCASVKTKGGHEVEEAEQVGKDLVPILKSNKKTWTVSNGGDTLKYDTLVDYFAFRERNGSEGLSVGEDKIIVGHLEMTAVSWPRDKGSWNHVGVK